MDASIGKLPESLRLDRRDAVAVLTLARAHKRNALDDETIRGIGRFFADLPAWARVVVLAADGDHFSAGLDLGELSERDAVEGIHHSRMWHRAFGEIQSSTVPVIAVLKGAVVGGGLELATAAHLRVAELSTFFALPEGQRGLFVGGGASVRVSRLIGTQRMTDMMLTGRVLSVSEGTAAGLTDYEVGDGDGLDQALELAGRIASNSSVTNFAVLQALPRIAEADPETGYVLESLMAAIAQSSPEAKQRMADFLAGRAAKVGAGRAAGEASR
ncbi:MAG: crotonase/enoyl-CoA hydratase family protein [Nocardioides sp.]|uniref:crotonase/enoyl-CoA hydratase family protein n=1 Tax=Nocardioides sp. TaxID=35761 RepID=UPI0039E67C75